MKERYWRIAGLAAAPALVLTLALTLAPAVSQAGYERVLPAPPKPQTVGCTPGTQPTSNAAGAKGPCPAQAEATANSEEMARKTGPSEDGASKTGPSEETGKTTPEDAGGHGAREKFSKVTDTVLHWVGIKPRPAPAAPAGPRTVLREGFACCNLHYDGDSITDKNYAYAELPMIPAGTPIEVLSYDRDKASVRVGGKSMRLGHEYGGDQESLETWVKRIVVTEDPRPRIGAYPPTIREAIQQGKVTAGMTREQAVASISFPRVSENAAFSGPVWRIWRSRRGEYQLNFQPDGRLGSVTGDDDVTNLVTYRQGK